MLYQLQQAPHAAKIVQQCVRENLPLPKSIADAPVLQLGLGLYFDAFWDLSSCRSSGFSMGPIPWVSINEYAKVHQLSEEQADDLQHYIRVMDNAYLKHHNPKKGKGGGKWQSPSGSNNSQSAWPSKPK